MSIALLSHPDCRRHDPGAAHPESPARLTAIEDQLVASGLEFVLRHVEAPLVTREQLLRVHTPEYVDTVFGSAPTTGHVALDGDTVMGPHSLAAARRAAGACVRAVDLVMTGEAGAAFCNIRPPGHHATRDRAMGFCLFNNVAVGAAHALTHHGLRRVAIVDFDIHYGNGTEAIFQADPRVMVCSSFQHPLFPFDQLGPESDHIVHAPLAAGADGTAFRAAAETIWLPRLDAFRPQLVLISAGFDGHHEDDFSDTLLTERDYGWVTEQIKAIADRHADGRIVSVLEGGYVLPALARSAAAHINALLGQRAAQQA
ncbi:MAG TPA: histone deacetylase family protein [Gammaproteobacteria bacterium]|nr:histone deacetylase family protein [Gammaproteobacteria bacterium]